MKLRVACISALLALSFIPNVSSSGIIKDSIMSQGRERSYYLFAPEGVKSSKPAPLILMLHGSGHNGLSLVEKWKDLANKEGIVIVGPDSADSAGWAIPGDGPDFLYGVIEAVKAKYPVDPRRIYLFGHSAGAIFALQMSLLESRYFAATAVHAGALQKESYPMFDYAKRKTPIALFIGTKDQVYPLAVIRDTRDEFNRHGFTVELKEIPNHDHRYYGLAPSINRSVWEFLRGHALGEDQQYERYRFN